MKAIAITSDEKFERLLDHIGWQAHRAKDYWYLVTKLQAATDDYQAEMNETPAFWGFTFYAFRDVVLSCLCRLYDQDPRVLSLGRFLKTIQTYRAYFSDEHFRERLHLQSLATDRTRVDDNALQDEIRSVSSTDPLVSRLVKLRNGLIAHNDDELVLGNVQRPGGLEKKQTQNLLDRAVQIASKYSLIYRASWASTKVVGADDYEQLLSLLREGHASVTARIEEEIRQAQAIRHDGRLVVLFRSLGRISGRIKSTLRRRAARRRVPAST